MLCPGKTSVIGTMQYLLPKDKYIAKAFFLCSKIYANLEKYFTGATIPHIYLEDYKNEEFNFDFWERQVEIVSVLSKCEKVIDLKNRKLQLLDKLIKARFVEMFGDVIHNSKKWQVCLFAEITFTIGENVRCKTANWKK